MHPFAVVDVSSWGVASTEGSGGDEKLWLTDLDQRRWLFKPRTEHVGWSQGEDWAERVVAHLAELMRIPAAQVELAVRDGRRGSISLSLRPQGWELQHGALLLQAADPSYTPRTKERFGHDLESIRRALTEVQALASRAPMTAFDAFAGYLVLDALVANQDRHEENWAVLRPLPEQGAAVLAGSYDHGSSLGFNLQDERRVQLLDEDAVGGFADRARAQRFDRATDGRLTLVQLAHRALTLCRPSAAGAWMEALRTVDEDQLEDVVAGVPDLSGTARRFTSALLAHNRRRLLDEH